MLARNLLEKLDQSGAGSIAQRRRRPSNSRSWARLGKSPCKQQERRLLVRDVPGQIFDPVAPVLEPAGPVRPLDVGDRGLARNHPFQAGRILFRRRTTHIGTPHNEDRSILTTTRKKGQRSSRP